jgi:branched-chain amino acid transport system substrate-binding protein
MLTERSALTFLCFITCIRLIAQDNIADLPLTELSHVSVHPKSAGILYEKKYDSTSIYLGLIVPLTSERQHVQEIKHSIDLAVGEINSQGGVLGRKLELVTADDGDNNELTVRYADTLIRKYHISALIGPTSSRRLLHLAKSYPTPPTLIISPSASSSEISALDDNDLVWRTTPSDRHQAKIAAEHIFNGLKKKKVSILYVRDAYGIGLLKEFKDSYKGTILAEVNYSPRVNAKTFDFSEKIDSLVAGEPDVIYLITGGAHAPAITREIGHRRKPHSKHPLVFSVDAVKTPDFLKEADAQIIEGMYGTSVVTAKSSAFQKKFADKYGALPTSSYCERAYDIAFILALAIEEARSTNCDDIKQKIRSVTTGGMPVTPGDFWFARGKIQMSENIYFLGASGKMTFDANGDLANGQFEVWRIVNGKFVSTPVNSN